MRTLLIILLVFCWVNASAQKKAKSYDKGEFRIKLALPYFNHLTVNPIDQPRSSQFGFLGESLGIEYSISNQSFLEINGALAVTASNPLPFPFDREGPYKVLSTSFVSTTYNRVVNRFTLGIGLNYSKNLIAMGSRSLGDSLVPNYTDNKKNLTIGITANSFYRVGKNFNVGLIYRPTFYNIKPNPSFNYDHLLTIEFNWRFRLNNK